MTIPTRIAKKWKSLIEWGQAETVAAKAGMNYIKLYRVIKNKKCTQDEFKALSSVFNEIEKENKAIVKKELLTETE